MWYNGASFRAPAPAILYHTQPWFVNSFFEQKLRKFFSQICATFPLELEKIVLTSAAPCGKLLSERERRDPHEKEDVPRNRIGYRYGYRVYHGRRPLVGSPQLLLLKKI
jgi:hypothetical protein